MAGEPGAPRAERTSRLSGFGKLDPAERIDRLRDFAGLTSEECSLLARAGPLSIEAADRMIENVAGIFPLPLGFAVNFRVNGRDRIVPMAVEEPSVVAGASNAARRMREGDGIRASADEPIMIGQVQLTGLAAADLERARRAILAEEAALVAEATRGDSGLAAAGGGARGLEVRLFETTPAGPMLVVHLLVDVRDAMGANAVNTMAEALAPRLEALAGGRACLRILSNLCDRRLARAEAVVPSGLLGEEGSGIARAIEQASALAEVDPYRAATHNKGILNGVGALVLATGNDWRAVEAGAHAYAAREGRYTALSRWRAGADGSVRGAIELPIAAGVIGGTTRAHPVARIALKVLGAASARELAEIGAAVGLAQNFAALHALATEGIQRGHMRLHARKGSEVRR